MSDFGKEDGLLVFKVRRIETKKAITVNNKNYRMLLELIDEREIRRN